MTMINPSRVAQALLVVMLSCPPSAFAIETSIEDQMAVCLDGGSTDSDATVCYENAGAAWDVRLNKVYADLRRKLAPEEFAALKEAQRKWVDFQGADEASWRALFKDGPPGSLDRVELAAQRVERISRRAHQLEEMLALVDITGLEKKTR